MRRNGAAIMMAAVIFLAVIAGLAGGMREIDRETGRFDPAGFAAGTPLQLTGDTVYGEIAVEHIRYMSDSLYDRFAFSYREREAAEWIVQSLLNMGYTWGDIEIQEYILEEALPFLQGDFRDASFIMSLYYLAADSPFMNFGLRSSQLSQNIILTVPGQSDGIMVVGAHYDSVFFPGASDNASGVALLLESAQRMIYKDNEHTIIYVFFGAEEAGLLGSFYYAGTLTEEQQDNILFMINADVLIEGPDLFYMAGYDDDGTPGANHITQTWDNIAREAGARHGFNLIPWPDGVYGPSDQLAFLPLGCAAMFLTGLETVDGWDDEGVDVNVMIGDMARVLHSPRDEFHYIKQAYPGKKEANLRAFSIFLEEMLLAAYH